MCLFPVVFWSLAGINEGDTSTLVLTEHPDGQCGCWDELVIMINLVSRAPHSIVAVVGQEHYGNYCGLLTGPFSSFRPESALAYNSMWAADNGCFLPGYQPERILAMLKSYSGLPGCKFVVVPDMVRDASGTLQLFNTWLGTYQRYGYPCAMALQNGIENCRIPWDSLACVFIGGDTEFKYSDTVREIVSEAKRRGKWVHNGRVNTPERILYSRAIGCDSFDGTHFTHESIDVAKYLPLQTAHPDIARVAAEAYRKVSKASNPSTQMSFLECAS